MIRVLNIDPTNLHACLERCQQGLKNPKKRWPDLKPGDICIVRRTSGRGVNPNYGPIALWYLRSRDNIEWVANSQIPYWTPSTGWYWRVTFTELVRFDGPVNERFTIPVDLRLRKSALYEGHGADIRQSDLQGEMKPFNNDQDTAIRLLRAVVAEMRFECDIDVEYMGETVSLMALLAKCCQVPEDLSYWDLHIPFAGLGDEEDEESGEPLGIPAPSEASADSAPVSLGPTLSPDTQGNSHDDPVQVLTYDEASAWLRISPPHLDELVMARAIPHTVVCGQIRFERRALEEWLRRRTVLPSGWEQD